MLRLVSATQPRSEEAMRTVDYSEILRGSAALAGMKFPDDIGLAELALFRTAHDRRFQAAYEYEAWPELCPTEKRYFAPKWNSATTYTATSSTTRVERLDVTSGQYFQSLQAGNTNNPPTIGGSENSAWWAQCRTSYSGADWASGQSYAVGAMVRNPGDNEFYQCLSAHTSGGAFDFTKFAILVPFVRRVLYAQTEDNGTAYTVIGEYLGATDKDWRATTKVTELPYVLDDEGAVFVQAQKAVTFVWLKFRTRRPSLTGEPFDASRVYTSGPLPGVGDQVYFLNETTTVANFYQANQTTVAGESPLTAPAKWDVVQIPYLFAGYLKEAGYADWLCADGQDEKAGVHEGNAELALDMEADKLWRQQGQNPRLNWRR